MSLAVYLRDVGCGASGGLHIVTWQVNSMAEDVRSIIVRLNDKFKGHAEARDVVLSEPTLQMIGRLPLSGEEEASTSGLIENSVHNLFEPVTAYGVLSFPLKDWVPERTLTYYGTDFAEICVKRRIAVREHDPEKHPQVLSACVVLFSKSRKVVYLHRRGGRSVTYPNCLHTYGGHFLPVPPWGSHDNESLLRTAVRQLWDEAAVQIRPLSNCPLLLAREVPTNFVQLVLLGVDVARAHLGGPELEGKAEAVRFDELVARLSNDKWVPSGRMHVLMWLALGAPGTKPSDWPPALGPQQIFERIMSENLHHERNAGISYDPMGIEIRLIKRGAKGERPEWDIGRPDCLFRMPHQEGWRILSTLVMKPGHPFDAREFQKADAAPARVIDALRKARNKLIAKYQNDDTWQKKLFSKVSEEWQRAQNNNNEKEIEARITSSFEELFRISYDKNKKKVIKSIIEPAAEITGIAVEDWEEMVQKAKKINDNRVARAERLSDRLPALHPAFLYAPVLLSHLLGQLVTTGKYVMYQSDPDNPILWDVHNPDNALSRTISDHAQPNPFGRPP